MRIMAMGLAFALAAAAPVPAMASACNIVVTARIRIAPGSTCWSYRGAATAFVGEFGGGQRISVRMRGEASEYDPDTGRTTTQMADRSPDVSGPGEFFTGGGDGFLGFTTPRGGVYRFSFSPCAMWGGQGIVEICAR